MCVAGNVAMQVIHELPAAFFTKHLQPAGNVKEAGARRVRVRHDHVTGIHWIRQVFPGFRRLQACLFSLDSVVANGSNPGVHADPCRWVVAINEFLVEFVYAGRGVGLQHTLRLQQKQ